jgi:hypothetical protein
MQIFTGENVYFGDRPRNAHHWMVISDELFDYREDLLADVARRHGVPEHLLERWRDMHEVFRKQIVKDKPFGKKLSGMELPVDGYDSIQVDVGTMCDGCHGEIDAGQTVQYHRRTGQTFCQTCSPDASGKLG